MDHGQYSPQHAGALRYWLGLPNAGIQLTKPGIIVGNLTSVLAGLWKTCLALQIVEVDMVAHVLLTGVYQWLVVPALQLALGQRFEYQAATALAGEHLLVDRRDVPFGPRLTQKRLEQWPVFR